MSNATARVARAVRRYSDEILKHSYGTVSSRTTLYTNAMVGLNGGYLAKFDDTASLTFFGLVNENQGNPIIPSDGSTSATQGAAVLGVDVRQPPAFELAISGVAITDIGRRVYALYDNEGTLDPSATTYANLIGVVKDLVFATDGGSAVSGYALVKPTYEMPRGATVAGVYSASGAVTIKAGTVFITKSSAAALTIADPATADNGLVMTFISTTAQTHTLSNGAGSGFNNGGGGSDVGTFGGAIGDGLQITAYGGKWLVNYLRNVTLA